jgi:hypothetical protein
VPQQRQRRVRPAAIGGTASEYSLAGLFHPVDRAVRLDKIRADFVTRNHLYCVILYLIKYLARSFVITTPPNMDLYSFVITELIAKFEKAELIALLLLVILVSEPHCKAYNFFNIVDRIL